MLVVMALMFVLGFFLDFIEIVSVVVPIVGPVPLMMQLFGLCILALFPGLVTWLPTVIFG